jgi:hypothetical protein
MQNSFNNAEVQYPAYENNLRAHFNHIIPHA